MNITRLLDTFSKERLRTLYGDDNALLEAQEARYREALVSYKVRHGDQDVILVRAPGRVDLLGSHTDYHQGFVLPTALDKDILIVAGTRDDRRIVVQNTDPAFAAQTFSLEESIPLSVKGSWHNYVKAAAQAFVQGYGVSALNGMNLVVDGCAPHGVPLAAGLSSSSALLVAVATAFAEIHNIRIEPKAFARFCGEAEWYVGTRGGFMDHFASVLNQQGHALFMDCRPVETQEGGQTFRTENIPLRPGYQIAVCNTHVKKEKSASSDYNIRVLETRIGLELLKNHFPDATHLRDIPENVALEKWLPAVIRKKQLLSQFPQMDFTDILQREQLEPECRLHILPRCRHVLAENARVLKGCDFLKAGQMEAFGAVMTESYISVRDDFDASCPELNALIESALQIPGVLGARIAGAGWGGCAVVLLQENAADVFQQQVAAEYFQKTGLNADIFLCRAGQGAGKVETSNLS